MGIPVAAEVRRLRVGGSGLLVITVLAVVIIAGTAVITATAAVALEPVLWAEDVLHAFGASATAATGTRVA